MFIFTVELFRETGAALFLLYLERKRKYGMAEWDGV